MKKNKKDGLMYPAKNPIDLIHRGIYELRRGETIIIREKKQSLLVRAAEAIGFQNPKVSKLINNIDNFHVSLAISGNRATAINLIESNKKAVLIKHNSSFSIEYIKKLIGLEIINEHNINHNEVCFNILDNNSSEYSAIKLCKISKLLPAALITPIDILETSEWESINNTTILTPEDILNFDENQSQDLEAVSEAEVPLADCEKTKIIAFRAKDGGEEHLAILIDFDHKEPVLTRIHSECFTGDLLASLKCDCGDQLRGAIKKIANSGGGILIYLAQEGRGIGLASKLRAYNIQKDGFDTVSANQRLGFDDDERGYLPAVNILRKLGISKVKLLTNNPQKVKALEIHGINVSERLPHKFPSNNHNLSYLEAKAKKLGHLL